MLPFGFFQLSGWFFYLVWVHETILWVYKSDTCKKKNCQHPLDHQKSNRVPENHLLLLIDYTKAFDCVDHNKLWNILKEMGIPDYLTCLLRNLCAGQEAPVRTGHGTDWLQIAKGVHQGCILSLCLFNLYAEYIMWNTRLDESQAGIKTAGKNISINHLR